MRECIRDDNETAKSCLAIFEPFFKAGAELALAKGAVPPVLNGH